MRVFGRYPHIPHNRLGQVFVGSQLPHTLQVHPVWGNLSLVEFGTTEGLESHVAWDESAGVTG